MIIERRLIPSLKKAIASGDAFRIVVRFADLFNDVRIYIFILTIFLPFTEGGRELNAFQRLHLRCARRNGRSHLQPYGRAFAFNPERVIC